MKIFIKLIIFLFLILFSKNLLYDINSKTVEMILKDDKLIYTTEESDEIIIYNIKNENEDTIFNYGIKKTKRLINLPNNKFALFGLASNSSLICNLYNNINQNEKPFKIGSFDLTYPHGLDYMVRMVTEDLYIISYINEKKYCNIFSYEIGHSEKGGRKQIPGIMSSSNLEVNTLECDSFDGLNSFCVYSIIDKSADNSIECFYSFNNIDSTSFNKNEIKANTNKPEAASLAKIEDNNEKKFIVCFTKSTIYYDSNNKLIGDMVIYCQFYIQKDNDLLIENLYTIGQNKQTYMNIINYENNIPIKIKIFKYSIILFFEVTRNGDDKSSLLYVSSLDLGLNIQDKIDESYYLGDQNILINDKYRIIYKRKELTQKTNIEYNIFNLACKDNQIFQFYNKNQGDGIEIHDKIIDSTIMLGTINYFISFSVDLLTYLYIDEQRIMEGLLNEKSVKNIQEIRLKYNKNLIKSYNYYIFYTKTPGQNYITSSNFCLFKVLNCYETCTSCNSEIMGTYDNHQCSSCITNYFRYDNGQNQKGFYNCYTTDDPRVKEGVFFDEQDQYYYKCDISCKECRNNKTCITCNNGYYFKFDSVIESERLNEKCYNLIPDHNYYLDTNSNFEYRSEIINFVYKQCYETCYSCITGGDKINNRCLECEGDNIHYPFDSTKCTKNKDDCQIWEIDDDKNIKCLSNCNNYLIHVDNNIDFNNEDIKNNNNQCVKDCQIYFNPYIIKQTEPLLTYSCGEYKYCITQKLCKSKKLSYDNVQCFPPSEGCVDLDNYTPVEIDTSKWELSSDKIEIKNKVKFIKIFNFENLEVSNTIDNFIVNQTNRYINELNKELEAHKGEYLDGIDFITLSRYNDFIITFYPIGAEDYVFNNLFEINHLCFINFTKFFEDINYLIKNDNYTILIGLIEHKNINIPINSINYFAILYDEVNNKAINTINLTRNASNIFIDSSYPLYNFENSEVKEKYSINLLSTIKDLYNIDKDLLFYDQNNKLFNDICYIYTSEVNTDMTIEDRINELYSGINFCENNCNLIKIYDKEESKNPRSLCKCKIKDNFNISEDNYSFNMDNNFKKKKLNTNALNCGKEVFSKNKIGSNALFWIYIIFILIESILLIAILVCGKSIIGNLLTISKNKNNNEESNNINNRVDKNYNNGGFNKLEVISNNEFNINKFKSVNVQENLKNSIRKIDDNKKNPILTSPIKKSEAHPPKRRQVKSNVRQKNDLIGYGKNANNETSIAGSLQINLDDNKSSTFEDIFDGEDNKFKHNNYIKNEKNFKENNYLVRGKMLKLDILKREFNQPNQEKLNKYKCINTNYYINDDSNENKRGKGNINLSEIEYNKNYYSDDEKNNSIIPNNVSKIKNIFTKSKLYGGESDLSRPDKLFPQDMENTDNNLIYDEKKKRYIKNKNNEEKENESDSEINKKININKEFDENNNISSSNNENSDITKKNQKLLSYDFQYDNNLMTEVKNNLKNDENYLNLSQKERKANINLKSNNEFFKKKNKKFDNLDKKNNENKILLKSSLNMSINSNNRLFNSKRSLNHEENSKIIKSDNYLDSKNKNSENEEIIYKQNIISSVSTINDNNENLELSKSKKFLKFFFDYFIKREIIFASFYNKSDNIPHFIRISTFIFVISFIFMINCLLLTNSDIHNRYIYAKNKKKIIEIKYIFEYEYLKIFTCTFVSIIFTMLCIKLLYGNIFFRISDSIKEDISPLTENKKNNQELKELKRKRKKFIKKYLFKSIILILIQIAFLFVFGFISICYIGTFPNTFEGFIARFFISFIFSFIICAFICLIIIIFYHLGFISCYNFIKKIY